MFGEDKEEEQNRTEQLFSKIESGFIRHQRLIPDLTRIYINFVLANCFFNKLMLEEERVSKCYSNFIANQKLE